MSTAAPPQWTLRKGVEALQRPLAINADANAKNNHNRKCGAATTAEYEKQGVQPDVECRYFGPAGAVMERYLANIGQGGEDEGEEAGWKAICTFALCGRAYQWTLPWALLSACGTSVLRRAHDPNHCVAQMSWMGPATPTSRVLGRLPSAAAA